MRVLKTFSVVLLICCVQYLAAQSDNQNSKSSLDDLLPNSSLSPQSGINQNTFTSLLQDGPVDPTEYRVGPGDVFDINVTAPSPMELQVPVTAEGTLIIPTVSSIYVSGKRLDSVKAMVLSEIKKKYLAAHTNIALIYPRTFLVTVVGAIKNERTIPMRATQRVDAAVNYRFNTVTPVTSINPVNGASSTNSQNSVNQSKPQEQISKPGEVIIDTSIAQRNIVVRHKDGSISHVDIERYHATGNTKYDPLLRDGDVITIPPKNLSNDFFSVFGAVNRQGTYEFVEGDSLTMALKIARGLTAIVDSAHIVIFRNSSADKLTPIHCDLQKILLGRQSDVLLKRGDRIVVYEKYFQRHNAKVLVEGEVRFPGYYPITQDSTYLSAIIQLAGGITEHASLHYAKLFRQLISNSDIFLERTSNFRASISPEEEGYYQYEMNIRLNRELVVSDFTDLIQRNDTSKDILLRDGDIVSIPPQRTTVYVFGQVLHPGHVFYVAGKDYEYYVDQAGGYTDYALKGDIKIVKAKSQQWVDPSETTIEEGDYVWVPKEIYRSFSYYVTLYSQILGIVGTVATLYLLIKSQ